MLDADDGLNGVEVELAVDEDDVTDAPMDETGTAAGPQIGRERLAASARSGGGTIHGTILTQSSRSRTLTLWK